MSRNCRRLGGRRCQNAATWQRRVLAFPLTVTRVNVVSVPWLLRSYTYFKFRCCPRLVALMAPVTDTKGEVGRVLFLCGDNAIVDTVWRSMPSMPVSVIVKFRGQSFPHPRARWMCIPGVVTAALPLRIVLRSAFMDIIRREFMPFVRMCCVW